MVESGAVRANIVRRWVAPLYLAVAAYFLARGIGIPTWRDWQPGDATDIAFLVFFGVRWLSRPLPQENDR